VAQPLRDELEAILRGWNAYEIARGANPVIDFDLRPDLTEALPIESRLAAYHRCLDLLARAKDAGATHVEDRARSDATYLAALLGARLPLGDYIARTQGCDAIGWRPEYIAFRRTQLQNALARVGIDWGPKTTEQLHDLQGPISTEEAAIEIRNAAEEFEPAVRAATGTTAGYHLSVETADVDAYWNYWLDGSDSNIRLRLNTRRAHFTRTRSRQAALHEVLAHGLQSASIAQYSRTHDVPWIRLFSVHAQQQTLLEGLAQALPLFVAPDDDALATTVRLAHYLQLVRAELHLAVNLGDSIDSSVAYAREHAPFWDDEDISDALIDRSVNPLLRSYLWSYAAGIDWFVNLAEADGPVARVLQAVYQEPLRPIDLAELWPEGPRIGGSHDWVPPDIALPFRATATSPRSE
jgi:hypothetical protein